MSGDYFGALCLKYRERGVFLDANLLLLYFVGLYQPDLIGTFKRLRAYSLEDFETVQGAFSYFQKVVVTPNVLTEVSNLSLHLEFHHRASYFEVFRRNIELLSEAYISSSSASKDGALERIGLTDVGVLQLSSQGILVLTDDFELSNTLSSRGIDSINLNHLRMARWRWI